MLKKWVLSAQEEKKGRGLVRPMLAAVCVFAMEMQALALPQGGQVAAGDVTIGAAAAGYQEITQTTDKGIINWQSFDIGQGEHVRFVQPSTTSNTLNRVTGSTNPSQILGRLSANGQITIINPNGVFFSKDSVVDVAGLTASTANIKDTDFLSNKMEFSQPGSSNAEIVNEGTITVEQAGIATLVAPSVRNDGIITAKLGRINLGGAEKFTVDLYGNGLMSLVVDDAALQTAVRNGGILSAEGGTITMSAKTAGELVASLTENSGTVSVASTTGKGGTVEMTATHVALMPGSTIDARGKTGGGVVLVGGDREGKGTLANAKRTFMAETAVINADATDNGDGGKVILWADEHTDFYGDISAKAGVNGGDGGFIETSGKQTLMAFGNANASAPKGKAGEWLLDPYDITINSAGPTANGTALPNFTSNNTGSVVRASDIQARLNAGTNVTITTGVGGSGNGDITWAAGASINKTAGGNTVLTLNASRNIVLNSAISATVGQLGMAFNAGGSGSITLSANLTSNGGNITFNRPVLLGAASTINAGIGTFTTNTGATINAGANNLTIITNNIALGGTISGTGLLNLRPLTATTTIGLGGGGGTFNLTTTELGYIQPGFAGVTIGCATCTGAMSVGPMTWNAFPLTLQNTIGGIATTITGPQFFGGNTTINAGTGTFTTNNQLNAGANNLTIIANGINLNGTISGTGLLNLRPFTATNPIYLNNVGGGFNLTAAELGFLQPGFAGVTIGCATCTGGMNVGPMTWNAFPLTLQNTTGGISFLGDQTLKGNTTINAGSGTIYFLRKVNGNVSGNQNLTVIGAGISMSSGHSWGWITPLGNVSLTVTNSLNIHSGITASSIFAQTTGAAADIVLINTLSASSAGDAITLVSGRHFLTYGSLITPSGRWLIYSTAPGSNTLNGLTAGFSQYSCSYPSCVVTGGATQNGFLYSSAAPSNILTITPSVVSVIYGDAAPANLTNGTGYGYTVSGFLGGDAGVATFGANTLVANTNYSAGSTVGGTYFINYSSGSLVLNCGGCSNSYTLSYANNASGVTVGQRTVTASLTGTVSKTYDGTNTATLAAGNYSFSNLYAPDAGLLSISNTIATYDTKNVGTLKTVTMSAAPVLSGTKAANYTIAATPLSGNIGTITPASITAITGITASNKVYDAATAATLNTGAAGFTGRLGSDILTVASSTGNFIDKNVGNAKTVNITGLTLGGADAGNYTLSSSTAAATANITPASIALTGLTVTKTYDANNTINGALFGSISTGVSGETLTFTGSTTTSSPNVGSYSTATGSLVLANGTGSASNYNLISVSGTANITPKSITLTGAKQNDGNTTILPVHLYTNGVIATGIGLEALTLTGSGSVGDAFLLNTPQSLDVNGLSLQNGINGGLAANYVFAGSGHTAMVTSGPPITLNITPSPVTVIYGDSASTSLTNYSYTYDSNLILAGDTLVFSANTLMGSSTYAPGVNAGTTHAINYDSGGLMMTCSSCVGNYVLQYQSAANILTVIPRSLTPTLIGTVSKTYDATSTASLAINNISLSPTWNGEDIRVSSIGSAFFDTPSVGNNKLITLTTKPTLQGFGGANASNYVLDSIPAPASIGKIDQKPVTVAYDASRITQTSMYTSTTPVITDLITSDAVSIDLTGAFALMDSLGPNAPAGTYASAVGFGGSASLTGASSGNYFLIQLSGTLTVLAPPPPPTPPIPNDTITINLERQGIPGTSMFSPQWPVLEQISPATLADAAFRPIFDSYKADPFNALFVADLERIINRKIAKNTPKQTIIPTVFPGIYGKF
ncbi:MAG: beta strand repeat-containing protein [Holosporales bacterium]